MKKVRLATTRPYGFAFRTELLLPVWRPLATSIAPTYRDLRASADYTSSMEGAREGTRRRVCRRVAGEWTNATGECWLLVDFGTIFGTKNYRKSMLRAMRKVALKKAGPRREVGHKYSQNAVKTAPQWVRGGPQVVSGFHLRFSNLLK